MADPICTFLFSVFVLFTTFTIIRDILIVLMEGESQGNWSNSQTSQILLHSISDLPRLRCSCRVEVQRREGWFAGCERGDGGAQPSHMGPHHEPGCADCTRRYR